MDNRIKPDSRLIGATSSTGFVPWKGMLDGTAYTADWLARQSAAGKMFTYHSGTGTAPNTFAGAYVNTTPDLDLSVPAGVLCIPIALTVQFETYGTSLLAEVIAAAGVGGVIAPTSATAAAGKNHRLDLGDTSGLTCVTDGTGATYMTSNVVEFFRDGAQFAISKTSASATVSSQDQVKFTWRALETGNWVHMYAPNSITRLNIHAASQGGTGFITLTVIVPDLTANS